MYITYEDRSNIGRLVLLLSGPTFYLFSAPGLPRDTVEKSQNASKSRRISCQLNHELRNDLESGIYLEVERRKPLVTFKIGQMGYRHYQVLPKASWIIE